MNPKKNSILSITAKFHEFEVSEIRDEDWEYWQAIRHDLYYQIQNQILNVPQTPSINHPSKKNRWNIIKKSLLFFLNSLFNKNKTIFFAASRYKDPNCKNVDYNIIDVLSLIDRRNSFIIDSIISGDDYQYKAYINGITFFLFNIYQRIKRKRPCIPQYIPTRIKETFGVNLNLKSLEDEILRYRFEKKWYRFYLKFMKPKAIFITQNGIQSAIFRSANSLNIPIVEFQHGIVYFGHPAYTYPSNIKRSLIGLPDYFLSYSDFWKNKIYSCYPVKQIISIGNSFASSVKSNPIKYDIAFISSTPHNQRFMEIISEMRVNGYSGSICLKLHPHQFMEIQDIRQEMVTYKNVDVIYDEESMKDVISKSKVLIAIESTSVYEALDAGKRVLILKEMSYEGQSDIFGDPNVTLVSNVSEILFELFKDNINFNSKRQRYFDNFKDRAALDFLNSKLHLDV